MGLFDAIRGAGSSARRAAFDADEYYKSNFGMDDGETVVSGGAGWVVGDNPSNKIQWLAATLTVMANGVVFVTNATQTTYVVTNKNRLIFGVWGGRSGTEPIAFDLAGSCVLRDTGDYLKDGGKLTRKDYTMPGPTGGYEKVRLIEIVQDEEKLMFGAVESAIAALVK